MKAMIEMVRQDKDLARKFYCLLVCCFSIVAMTLAWFFNFKTASSEQMEAVSVAAVSMQVSLDGCNYSDSAIIPIPENVVFEPISGSGTENKMYIPELPANSNDVTQATGWRQVTYDAAAEQNSFMYFTIYFKADRPGCVALSDVAVEPAASAANRQNESYKNTAGEDVDVSGTVDRQITSSLTYTLISNNTLFTKDYIAGAARVGLVNTTNETPSTALTDALIIANDTYELSCTITNGICSCTMKENASSVASGSYYNGTAIVSCDAAKTFTESQIKGGTTVNILELESDNDGNYVGHIDVYLWIDGTDHEAHELLSGGQLRPSLTFSHVTVSP